jgi:hypothetical protein
LSWSRRGTANMTTVGRSARKRKRMSTPRGGSASR